MELIKININDLKQAEYNPRKELKPSDAEYQKIKRSLEEFGYVDPIIVNKDMTIIGGHQRCNVMKELGYSEVECIVIDIDKTKEKALNVALNKITGEWDVKKLNELILDLNSEDYDLTLTGFDEKEIEGIINPEKEEEEDGEIEFTEILGEEHNYIVLYFDNEVDWLQAESIFEISEKKLPSTRKDGIITKKMERKSVGRVLNGKKAMEMMRRIYEN